MAKYYLAHTAPPSEGQYSQIGINIEMALRDLCYHIASRDLPGASPVDVVHSPLKQAIDAFSESSHRDGFLNTQGKGPPSVTFPHPTYATPDTHRPYHRRDRAHGRYRCADACETVADDGDELEPPARDSCRCWLGAEP